MKNKLIALASLLCVTLISFQLTAAESPALKCETGPVKKSFGGTSWLVYACDDDHSLVIVSDTGNPAMPFYFMVSFKNGAYTVHGEGSGDKAASTAANMDISKLKAENFKSLIKEAKNA